jgi:hypothetical protein
MAMANIDWRVLRGAMILLVVSVVAGGSLLAWAATFEQGTEREYQRKQNVFRNARNRYQTLDDEQRMRETYLPKYRALQAEGVIGDELRLDWIEALRDAVLQVKPPSLTWEISSRAEHQPHFPLNTGVFKLYSSEMNLGMGLLHEGDLPAVLADLDRSGTGVFTVTGCVLSRVSKQTQQDPTKPNINASCDLLWYTIEPPPSGAGT